VSGRVVSHPVGCHAGAAIRHRTPPSHSVLPVYQRAQRMSSPICQVVTNTNIMVRQIMAKRPIGKGNVPDLYSVLSAPERGKGWVQIAITIPKAHLRVLDAE